MSASTETNARTSRRTAPPAANGSVPATETSAIALGVNTIEINDIEVSVPVRFGTGHVLSENEAKVLQAAYERQFTNNQNALAKSRAEGKNATPQPDASALAALFGEYAPSVGGTPRQSTMDKLRHEAAWRMWTALVAAHNDNVEKNGKSADYVPVIARAKNGVVNTTFRAVKAADGTVETTAQQQKDTFTAALLAAPHYAEAIQTVLDAIMAERGTKPVASTDTVVASGMDLI